MSQVKEFSFLLFLYGAPRVCHKIEIKCYKNTIRTLKPIKYSSDLVIMSPRVRQVLVMGSS